MNMLRVSHIAHDSRFNPLTPTVVIYGYSYTEHQSVRMSKITNDGLIQFAL